LPNELAAREKITTQSMSQILNHLAELGYINRRSSKEDKRKSFISLSVKGTSVVEQVVMRKITGYTRRSPTRVHRKKFQY
jgi:DNA-binding MarR family transcriptional regulator